VLGKLDPEYGNCWLLVLDHETVERSSSPLADFVCFY